MVFPCNPISLDLAIHQALTYIVVVVGGQIKVIQETVCQGIGQIAPVQLQAKELFTSAKVITAIFMVLPSDIARS